MNDRVDFVCTRAEHQESALYDALTMHEDLWAYCPGHAREHHDCRPTARSPSGRSDGPALRLTTPPDGVGGCSGGCRPPTSRSTRETRAQLRASQAAVRDAVFLLGRKLCHRAAVSG